MNDQDKCPNGDGWLIRITQDGITTLRCPTCGHEETPHRDPLERYRAAMMNVRIVHEKGTGT